MTKKRHCVWQRTDEQGKQVIFQVHSFSYKGQGIFALLSSTDCATLASQVAEITCTFCHAWCEGILQLSFFKKLLFLKFFKKLFFNLIYTYQVNTYQVYIYVYIYISKSSIYNDSKTNSLIYLQQYFPSQRWIPGRFHQMTYFEMFRSNLIYHLVTHCHGGKLPTLQFPLLS